MSEKLRSVAIGKLKLGGAEIECHVLSDGRRVLSTKQVQAAIGARGKDAFAVTVGRIPSKSAAMSVPAGIEFDLVGGGRAQGYEGTFVVDVCAAYQDALLDGLISNEAQKRIAIQAAGVVRACAKVGIVALIDEATNYQQSRAAAELQSLYDKFIRRDFCDWDAMWSSEIDAGFCRLYRRPVQRNPRFMASINRKLHEYLASPIVAAKLKEENPNPQHGTNHHCKYTDPVRDAFRDRMRMVVALLNTTSRPRDFWHKMSVQFRGAPLQLEM